MPVWLGVITGPAGPSVIDASFARGARARRATRSRSATTFFSSRVTSSPSVPGCEPSQLRTVATGISARTWSGLHEQRLGGLLGHLLGQPPSGVVAEGGRLLHRLGPDRQGSPAGLGGLARAGGRPLGVEREPALAAGDADRVPVPGSRLDRLPTVVALERDEHQAEPVVVTLKRIGASCRWTNDAIQLSGRSGTASVRPTSSAAIDRRRLVDREPDLTRGRA